jgi:hypothetical protein
MLESRFGSNAPARPQEGLDFSEEGIEDGPSQIWLSGWIQSEHQLLLDMVPAQERAFQLGGDDWRQSALPCARATRDRREQRQASHEPILRIAVAFGNRTSRP